jgi:DNA-nicking Smr family endonuclease
MKKKPELSEEERDVFRQAMRDVKRISLPAKVQPAPPRLAPRRKRNAAEVEEPAGEFFSDFEKEFPVSGDTMLVFSRSGLQDKKLRKLRAGQYNVEATLDLHGQTADQAKESLQWFLGQCKSTGVRHVLIIHGKGRSLTQPVLKNKLNNWLRQTSQVIAFSSATAKDGNSGAMYVLLKNHHREKPA